MYFKKIYHELSKIKESYDYLIKAKQMYMDIYEDINHSDIVELYISLGGYYLDIGQLENGFDYYTKAYEMQLKMGRNNSLETAIILSNISCVI